MFRLFNNSLGVPIGTPFEDNRKCGADLFGFGSVLGSFIDTAVSSSDRRAANELNYFANQETNAANMRMNQEQLAAARENWAREQANFEKQRQWSLQDRAFENEYNSPKALMQRYRQAGLNPYLMMDGQGSQPSASGSTGQAPQFGSPPSNIPAQSAHFEPNMPNGFGLGAGINNGLSFLLQADLQDAQISRIRTQNDLDTLETLSKVSERDWNSKQIKANVDNLLYDLKFKKQTEGERMNNLKYVNDQILADTAYKNAQTALSDAEKSFKLDENIRAWAQLKQWIANSVSQISLNASQAHKNYQDAATSFQDELHKIFDNSKMQELYNSNKKQFDLMLRKLDYEQSVQGFKDFVRMLQGFIPMGGMWN